MKKIRGCACQELLQFNEQRKRCSERIEDGLGVIFVKGLKKRVLMESGALVESPLFCELLPPTVCFI